MSETGLGTTLKRLSRREGVWVLEVERLVPLGRFMHQPVPQSIEGEEQINRHLRALPHLAPMVDVTEILMKSDSSADCYEIWRGDWLEEDMVNDLALRKKSAASVVASGPPSGGASRKAVAKLEKLHDKLAERLATLEGGEALSVEIEKMSALISELADRLVAVEAKLGIEGPPRSKKKPASKLAKESSDDEPEVVESNEEDSNEEDSHEEESTEEPAEEPAEEKSDRDQAASAEETRLKRIRPPSLAALRQAMADLLGEDIALKECDAKTDFRAGSYFRALINDDENRLVGMMVVDLEATVRLGSRLLMLPPAEIDAQVQANEAREDTIDVMGEICKTLADPINGVKSNPHVSVSGLEALLADGFDWVDTTKRRIDVAVDGGGVFVIAAFA